MYKTLSYVTQRAKFTKHLIQLTNYLHRTVYQSIRNYLVMLSISFLVICYCEYKIWGHIKVYVLDTSRYSVT